MVTVDTHEAKTRFSKLLDLVAAGEEVVITCNAQEVARLVASGRKAVGGESLALRIERWRNARVKPRLNGLKIRDLKNAGRR